MLSNQRVVQLYHGGLSCGGIARMDGRSESTIRNRLLNAGVVLRSRAEANRKFPTDLAIRLYNLGLNAEQIGELLGVHETTVVKRFQSVGFPMRTHAVATGVSFSPEEFERFFLTDQFLDLLSEVAV